MAHWVKTSAPKPADLSSMPRTYMADGENWLPQTVLCYLCMCALTQQINKYKLKRETVTMLPITQQPIGGSRELEQCYAGQRESLNFTQKSSWLIRKVVVTGLPYGGNLSMWIYYNLTNSVINKIVQRNNKLYFVMYIFP